MGARFRWSGAICSSVGCSRISHTPGFNPLDASRTFSFQLQQFKNIFRLYITLETPLPQVNTCPTERNFSNDSFLRNCPYAIWKLSESLVPGGSEGKESICNARDLSCIPGSDRFPGEEMATHSSILAWRTPWTEEPGRLQSMGSQRVRHNCRTNISTFAMEIV